MQPYPTLRRLLAAGVTICVLGLAALSSAPRQRNSAAFAVPQPAPGRNWPMFGGTPQRNMVNLLETDIPVDWSVEKGKQKNIKWIANLGSKAYGGVVVAGGKVFIGTNNEKPRDPAVKGDKGILMCFDEATGRFLWQAVHDKLPQGIVNDWPREGLPSMPAIEGDRVYYVSNRCELVCVNTDGKQLWRLDMIKDLGVFPHNLSLCSPLIVDDLIFVVTSNGVNENHVDIPAPRAPSFLAVHKKTGKVAWQDNAPTAKLIGVKADGQKGQQLIRDMVDRGELLMHGQWSNPTFAEAAGQAQVIFPGGDGWLRGFEPRSGRLLWKFDCNPKNAQYKLGVRGTRSDFIATPVVHGPHLYIGVGQDPEHDEGVGHFWCIDLVRAVEKGRTNKDHDVSPVQDNVDPKAEVNKHSALVWHYGEPSPPQWKVGRRYVFGRTLSTAAVHDGLVYVAELGGYLHCLDARTGQQMWTHYAKAPIWSSPYYVDGKVYLGTEGEEILVFKHGRKKELLNTIDMEREMSGVPVAVNGVLFVVAGNRLVAIARDKQASKR